MKLFDFICKAINYLLPNCKHYKNWHVKIIAEYLEELGSLKNSRRLIINLPPRYLKSTCITVAWTAWCIGRNPSANIIVASYSQFLSNKHSIDTRNLIQSSWYKKVFPGVELSKDQNTKNKFATTARGFRMATSIGGTLTGEGADILIVDDPITPMQALSKTYRTKNIEWFEQSFMNRLNNRRTGMIVIVMHRLHQDDLSQYLLSKKVSLKWRHLCLPALNQTTQKIYSIKNHKLLFTRKPLTPLSLKHHSLKEIKELQLEVGSYAFESQYQQNPLALDQGLIKNSWFKRHIEPICNIQRTKLHIFQSWDTANSADIKNDYSVCITIASDNVMSYICDMCRVRMQYHDLKEKLIQNAIKWEPEAILIENKASGQQIIQELSNLTSLPIIKINTSKSKIQRIHQSLATMEAGKISIPKEAPWLAEFEHELFSFPQTRHDDQIDSLTQYIIWNQKRSLNRIKISSL